MNTYENPPGGAPSFATIKALGILPDQFQNIR
jgi:hypothetical protein